MNYLADSLLKHLCADFEATVGDKVGEIGEICSAKCKHREGCLSAGYLAVKLIVDIKGDIVIGKNSDGLVKTLCVDDKSSLSLDGYGNDGCTETLRHIVGGYLNESVIESLDKYTLYGGNGVFVGDHTHCRCQLVHKK